MKPKHYLVHLIRKLPRSSDTVPIETVKQEIRKTLSKEQLTQAFKKRLLAEHKAHAAREELELLERELEALRDVQDSRVLVLRAQIASMKQRISQKEKR